ncbi:MAG: HIT family protein [Steroidobacteraceae bacterium]|jgi:histidine triad (HIT) family protein|nr:HIT family protein [Steroidobacteraceae bacterium]
MPYDPNNVFARMVRGEIPCVRLAEDEHTLAFMDIMPQSPGHALVIPKVAGENLLDTPPEAATAAIRTTQRVARAVQKALEAPGVIVTQFNGAAAGQTVFHLHFHVIPVYANQPLRMHAREKADPQQLEELAARIRAAL